LKGQLPAEPIGIISEGSRLLDGCCRPGRRDPEKDGSEVQPGRRKYSAAFVFGEDVTWLGAFGQRIVIVWTGENARPSMGRAVS